MDDDENINYYSKLLEYKRLFLRQGDIFMESIRLEGDVLRPSGFSPCLQKGLLDQVALDFVWLCYKHLQARRLQSSSWMYLSWTSWFQLNKLWERSP